MSAASGFSIAWLRLTGPTVQPAQVDFKSGLNVIWGASETGKSFILSCIDFMLGRKKPPKKIAELEGYTTVWLAFIERSGRQWVLERSLNGGAFRVFSAEGRDWALSSNPQLLQPEHDPARTDTISHLLLSAAGSERAMILTGINKGTTRQLSFRDVAHMTVIDEVRIIAERTPVYPEGQFVNATAEMATFSHLISGMEWKGNAVGSNVKLEKATWRAKNELYEKFIAELERESGERPPSLDELERGILASSERINESASKIEESSRIVSETMNMRKRAWEGVQQAQSRLLVIEQMSERFNLLRKHYLSDLERLQFISDGDFFLAQLGTPHCPFCGEALAEHTARQLGEEAGKANIQEAATEEANKISANLKDLERTLAALDVERTLLSEQARLQQQAFSNAEKSIRQELEPRMVDDRTRLAELVDARARMISQQFVQQRLAEMTAGRAALGMEPRAPGKKVAKPSPDPDPAFLRLLAIEIAAILRSWRYLKMGDVGFDEEMDIVVAGEPRFNRGKGIRAVLHSAFTIGIMSHCNKENLKHPGVVLLDSPLTSFKENDHYEVDGDIQFGFFMALSKLPEHQQVIVFENKEPPANLRGTFHEIHFSGPAGSGRRGFIPDQKRT